MPKISVIIPVYNVEKYLRQCLDSVVNQTLKDIEIICVNDGSTDNSQQILEEYAKKDKRIKLINQENQGQSVARNVGIKVSSGEFVSFIDSDDLLPTNDILEILYNKAVENNVKICGGEFSDFSNSSYDYKQDYESTLFDGYLFERDGVIEYKDFQFDYGFARFIYNREFLRQNNIYFPSYTRYEDPPFLVKSMILAGKFYAVHKISYGYRMGHKEVKFSNKNINDLFCGLLDNLEYAKKYQLKTLEEYTKSRFFQHYDMCSYILNIKTVFLTFQIIGVKAFKIYLIKILKLITKAIFSLRNSNDKIHKIITVLGIKLKIKRKCKNA